MATKWIGEWLFDCPTHRRHGCTGTKIVQAVSPVEARENLKDEVARRIAGTPEHYDHVVVRRLTPMTT